MYQCKCEKTFEARQSLIAHKRWCLVHRDGKPVKVTEAWNKGQTKHTDARLVVLGEKISVSLKGKPGTPRTEKEKLNLSALQSKRLFDGYANGTRAQAGGYCKWFEVDGVKVQGTWELRAAMILASWKSFEKILSWERCKHRFQYSVNNNQHTYTPDFLIRKLDGSEYILEIKGRKSLVDDLKWASARMHFELIVWNLQDIKQAEIELATRRRS